MKEVELKLQVPPGQHRAAIMAAKLPVAQSPQHLLNPGVAVLVVLSTTELQSLRAGQRV